MMPTQYLSLKKSFDFRLLFAGLPPFFSLMLVAWVITLLSLPIIEYFYGEMALLWGVVAGVLLQAAAVLLILCLAWGARRTAWTAAVVLILAWAIEAVGSSSGVPFGPYAYTHKLQPQLSGVPLLIPLAWLMMLPPAWAVAERLTGEWRSPTFVAASALAFTAWDLFLDPQMTAWSLWEWTQPGGYFGIPWVNYIGWLIASAVITTLARPAKLPIRPLLLIYTITWALETAGLLLFWHLPGPALVGGLVMGSLVWLAWTSQREEVL
jgi:uncharacterized membrane protein